MIMGVKGRASSRAPAAAAATSRQQLANHHQGASDGFDVSLTASSGTGDEQQTYESDEIRQVYHQHHRDCLHQQQQYALRGLDGEIANSRGAVQQATRIEEPSSSFLSHEVQQQASAEAMRIKQTTSQHRELQAHVHQQLQRIYGDRSQPPKQHPHHHNQRHHQDQRLRMNLHKQMIQQQQQQQQQRLQNIQDSQDDQFSSHESTGLVNNMRPFNNHLHQHQQQQQATSSSSEQTYDSLSSPNLTPHQQHRHFKDCRRRGAPISSIPEEDDAIGIAGDERRQDGDNEDPTRMLLSNREDQSRKQNEIVRNSQLESLHYATATAAALLSATANAAAAIAATTETRQQQFKQPPLLAWPVKKPTSSKINETIEEHEANKYSHPAYQEVSQPPKRSLDSCCSRNHQQERNEPISMKINNCIHQQQHQQMVMMKENQKRLYGAEAPAASVYKAGLPPAPMGPSTHEHHMHQLIQLQQRSHNHHRHHQQQQAMQQQAMQQHQTKQLLYHQALMNRPIPPQPPSRGPMMMMVLDPSRSTVRQDQAHFVPPQVQQQPPPIMPTALAVVHTGKAASAAKADLIGRMLINNMVAAQRVAAESHYNLKGPPQPRAALEPYQMLAPIREKLYNSAQQQQQQVFASSLPVGRAGSDSSAHSRAPLVVNRDLVPMSFIERLCRIDLTLFWWSLLLISLLFVGIVVTFSRYVL